MQGIQADRLEKTLMPTIPFYPGDEVPMWICPYCGQGVYRSIIEHLYGGRGVKGCGEYWETVGDVICISDHSTPCKMEREC